MNGCDTSLQIRTALEAIPIFAKNDCDFIPTARKIDGCATGTVYVFADSPHGRPQRWMGKMGRSKDLFLNDPLSERSIKLKNYNYTTIMEKIAADLYQVFSQEAFKTPLTYLSAQRVLDTFTMYDRKAQETRWEGIDRSLRIMSQIHEDYHNFAEATTDEEGEILSFIPFLRNFHRPPEFILTPQGNRVPLHGLMELLATARVLADTDCLGGSASNAGWIWEKDDEGNIVGARAFKIDPGESFQFVTNDWLINWVLNTLEGYHQGPNLKDLRDIQTANNFRPTTIFWDNLTIGQKREISQTCGGSYRTFARFR